MKYIKSWIDHVNLFIDRSYGGIKRETGAQSVDFPHIRSLFDSLLDALTVLQVENSSSPTASGNGKRKISKALAAFPCGYINVEEVASVPLRLLRINSTSNPKQARADKRLYDELIQIHLADLHCVSWKVLGFLFGNVEMGTEVFERELAALVRDQIKSDLKTFDSIGKGSECALNNFNHLMKSSTSFNGQVFVCELISSGILTELSTKSLRLFASLLRTGPDTDKLTGSSNSSSNKKARYHQINESDQKRLEMAQEAFCADLEKAFVSLSRTFGVFESCQGHLNPQDHVGLSENVLMAVAVLFQSQHNYKYVPSIVKGDYLQILVGSLSFAMVSFQPAYLPPFLPLAMRLLNGIAGRADKAGLAARKALLQVELIIHPRRAGPVTFRPTSETIIKVFERTDPIVGEKIETLTLKTVEVEIAETIKPEKSVISPFVAEVVKPFEPQTINVVEAASSAAPPVSYKPVIIPVVSKVKVEEHPQNQQQVKRSAPAFNEDDDDDEPLPQIVESGPDEI